MAAPVIVTVPSNQLGAPQHTNADLALDRLQQDAVEGEPVHHRKGGLYVNPWKSFTVSLYRKCYVSLIQRSLIDAHLETTSHLSGHSAGSQIHFVQLLQRLVGLEFEAG